MHFSIWELLLILVIVLVLFGGSRLRNLGSDLGSAIRGFRDAMKEGDKAATAEVDPKKLEASAAEERVTPTGVNDPLVNDPLAKDREKV